MRKRPPSSPGGVRSAKSARLEARLTGEMKKLIERAAAYEGRSLSDFVIYSAQRTALEVIEQHELIRLNAEQSRQFAELILNPPKANARLRKALAEHGKRVVSK